MTRAEAQALADQLLEHPQVDVAELRLSYPQRWAKGADNWSVTIHDTRFGWLLLETRQSIQGYYRAYTGEDDG